MLKTDLYVTVMPDGSEWGVPLSVIAENKARYYMSIDEVSFEESLEETYKVFEEFESEIADWASNNMDWSEVSAFAILLRAGSTDFDEGWTNGEHFLTAPPEGVQ